MSSFDRQFAVDAPDLTRIYRKVLPVSDAGLVNPIGTSPVPFIDGEFAAIDSSYKMIRATDATKLCYAIIEDRGDYGVQASKKVTMLFIGGYEADTVVFNTGLLTLGAPVMLGVVNNSLSGSVNRAGLIAQTGTNLVIGYITRLAATNNNKLRFQQTLV